MQFFKPKHPFGVLTPRVSATLATVAAAALLGACQPGDSAAPEASNAEAAPAAWSPSTEAQAAAAHITPEMLRADIAYLSSDDLAGRGPASEGDLLTQKYLSEQMEAIGLEPGFDGEWTQSFDIVGINATVPKTWTFRGDSGKITFDFWDEFIAGSGVQTEEAKIKDAEVVFVGYGIEAPEYDWNDYKGIDLTGKVLLMLNNDPHWDPELFEGDRRLYYGRWGYKYETAAAQGAVGAIIIHTQPSAGYPYQVVQTSWTGEQFELPDEGEARCQIEGWLTEEAATELVAHAGHDLAALIDSAKTREFEPVSLGLTTSLKLENKIQRATTANVAGLLPGSDTSLSSEVVVFTAHHDHLGVSEPDADGDTIYNGALDNGAGVAQVLAAARSYASMGEAPRRSMLFLFVAAEEQGLLGSAYYALHPTFHPGKIAANINLDGGNIWGRTKDLTFIGYGKSSLDGVVEAVAGSQGRTVQGDQFPDRGFFYRSDQFNFAKIGVPALYTDTGTNFIGQEPNWGKEQIEQWEAVQYHQPSDELEDSWNFDGMIEDAHLVFYVGLDVANSDSMPTWTPGDEFEDERQAALASAP